MSWLVAGVAAERFGVEHALRRVRARKAAALRSFHRAHTKTDPIDAPERVGDGHPGKISDGWRLSRCLRLRRLADDGRVAVRFHRGSS